MREASPTISRLGCTRSPLTHANCGQISFTDAEYGSTSYCKLQNCRAQLPSDLGRMGGIDGRVLTQDLSVPKTPSGSCRERVLVDETADPVVPVDAERVQIANGCGQRRERSGLAERAMRPVGVVMSLVLAQYLS
jgi:hypothetical protein